MSFAGILDGAVEIAGAAYGRSVTLRKTPITGGVEGNTLGVPTAHTARSTRIDENFLDFDGWQTGDQTEIIRGADVSPDSLTDGDWTLQESGGPLLPIVMVRPGGAAGTDVYYEAVARRGGP